MCAPNLFCRQIHETVGSGEIVGEQGKNLIRHSARRLLQLRLILSSSICEYTIVRRKAVGRVTITISVVLVILFLSGLAYYAFQTPIPPSQPTVEKSSSSSSTIRTYQANTTETFPAGSTFDTLILGNITITCNGCEGEELHSSQFQGFSDGGPYTTQSPLRGNGSATYSYGVMDSPVTWNFSKNTINGTLEVKVYAENLLIFDRNTTTPYGTLSGYWLRAGCACG